MLSQSLCQKHFVKIKKDNILSTSLLVSSHLQIKLVLNIKLLTEKLKNKGKTEEECCDEELPRNYTR